MFASSLALLARQKVERKMTSLGLVEASAQRKKLKQRAESTFGRAQARDRSNRSTSCTIQTGSVEQRAKNAAYSGTIVSDGQSEEALDRINSASTVPPFDSLRAMPRIRAQSRARTSWTLLSPLQKDRRPKLRIVTTLRLNKYITKKISDTMRQGGKRKEERKKGEKGG